MFVAALETVLGSDAAVTAGACTPVSRRRSLLTSSSASLNFNVVVSGASAATTTATSLAATVTTAVSDNTFATALADAQTTLSYSGSAMSSVVATGATAVFAPSSAPTAAPVPSPKTSPPWWVYAWWVYALAAVALLMVLIAVVQCVRKARGGPVKRDSGGAAAAAQREVDADVEVELTESPNMQASPPPAIPPRPSRPPRPIRNDATPGSRATPPAARDEGAAPLETYAVGERVVSKTGSSRNELTLGLTGEVMFPGGNKRTLGLSEMVNVRRALSPLARRGLAHVATVAWVSLRQGVEAGEAWAGSPLVCGCSDSLLRPHAADRAWHQQRLHQVWGA